MGNALHARWTTNHAAACSFYDGKAAVGAAPRNEAALEAVTAALNKMFDKVLEGECFVLPRDTTTPPFTNGAAEARAAKGGRLKAEAAAKRAAEAKGVPMETDSDAESDADESTTSREKDGGVLDLEGIVTYGQALDLDMGSYESFVLTDVLQVEGFQIPRQGFVSGWKQIWMETGGRVSADWNDHKKFLRSRADLVRRDASHFKRVYASTFVAGREPGSRELGMELGLRAWSTLFEPTMHGWQSANVDWYDAWREYLTERFWVLDKNHVPKPGKAQRYRWARSVSKDLWNQTLVFAAKTLQDESLSFWSEEQAWPAIIDDFVVWCRARGIVPAAASGAAMEVDK